MCWGTELRLPLELLMGCQATCWDSMRPHRWQSTRLPHPWDSQGKNTGVGCHFLLQCMKVKSESEVAQSCPTLSNPMDCSLPGSSVHGIFQARVLEWGATAFSVASLPHSNLRKQSSASYPKPSTTMPLNLSFINSFYSHVFETPEQLKYSQFPIHFNIFCIWYSLLIIFILYLFLYRCLPL